MAQIVQNVATFRADRPWGAHLLTKVDRATVKLHWADQPYKWHVNDGSEAFVVLHGAVDMYFKEGGQTRCVRLGPAEIFIAEPGDEHVAHPIGEARILVIESEGSA